MSKDTIKEKSVCCGQKVVQLYPTGLKVCEECQQPFKAEEDKVVGYEVEGCGAVGAFAPKTEKGKLALEAIDEVTKTFKDINKTLKTEKEECKCKGKITLTDTGYELICDTCKGVYMLKKDVHCYFCLDKSQKCPKHTPPLEQDWEELEKLYFCEYFDIDEFMKDAKSIFSSLLATQLQSKITKIEGLK